MMDSEFVNNLPTLEQLNSALDEFKNIDWSKADTYSEIDKVLPSILKTAPIF